MKTYPITMLIYLIYMKKLRVSRQIGTFIKKCEADSVAYHTHIKQSKNSTFGKSSYSENV